MPERCPCVAEVADPKRLERALSRKESALNILAPLGFVDAEDADMPGAIRHRPTDVWIDTEVLSPSDVVSAIVAHGEARARDTIRRKLSAAVDSPGV